MIKGKSCCAADALRKIKQITIGGTLIGISNLDGIFKIVSKMGFQENAQLKKELLKQVKIYNYVSPAAENDYADAIYAEYTKWMTCKK